MTLPAESDAEGENPRREGASSDHGHPQSETMRRVLLIEDNPGDALWIHDMIDMAVVPIHVDQVDSMAGARAALATGAVFDAILLDLRLPDAEGIECLNEIRPVAGDAAILVLTGLGGDELALECLAAGAQDYIVKSEARPYGLTRAIGYAITRVREARATRIAGAMQARIAAIVEASSDAIISCDDSGLVTSWNPGAEAIFGFARSEAIGRSVHALIRAPESDGPDPLVLADLARRGEFGPPRELDRLRRDGSRVSLSAVAFPMPGHDGERTGFGAICRDITEQRRRDEELRSRNAMLETRDNQMRALAARLIAVREDERLRLSRTVHDELGQLLTGIKMDLRWIEKRLDRETVIGRKLIDTEELIDRTVSTVQAIATELRPSALDALGLSAAIRDELRRFSERSGLWISADAHDGPQPDPESATALFRIFQEILTNVARHAGASKLTIRFAEEDGNWLLRVRDDGVGMPPGAATRPSSLGLLGMTERAEALGGTIEFDTSEGKGTEVIVRIPKPGESGG